MFLKCVGFHRSKHTSSSERKYPTIIEELCRQFSLADLRKSTNNFDDRHIICYRRGCYLPGGVYKGSLEHNGVNDYAVALKRICGTQNQRVIEFKKEIELLCQLHHPNLISLIGFYEGQNERILVYDYMSNGSLDRKLERGELSWKKRVEICIGAARGLHYLHAGAKRTIIHRNIKPSNILLDANMEPKLSDFSVSVQGQHFMSKPKPIKVDSAAEVVCGRKYMESTEWEFLGWPAEEKVDPNIKGKIAPECWRVFTDIVQGCVKYEADERPTMGEVEVQLEYALWLQEQADITNIHGGDYVLLSKTIINLKPGG